MEHDSCPSRPTFGFRAEKSSPGSVLRCAAPAPFGSAAPPDEILAVAEIAAPRLGYQIPEPVSHLDFGPEWS